MIPQISRCRMNKKKEKKPPFGVFGHFDEAERDFDCV